VPWTNSGTDGTDPNAARTYCIPLVGQQHDVRRMTTIGVTSSVPEFLSAENLLMQRESARQGCLQIDWFSGDGVVEIQKLGVQEISSIAGEAGEIFKRLAG
jgi:hypothetical protein